MSTKTSQQAANRARNRAYRRLAKLCPEQFAQLYEEEALRENVLPRTARARMISQAAEK